MTSEKNDHRVRRRCQRRQHFRTRVSHGDVRVLPQRLPQFAVKGQPGQTTTIVGSHANRNFTQIPQCASSPAAHSRFILAAKITLLHFFTSSEISLAKSSGDPARVVPPRLASCAWSFGTAILTLTSLFSFSMTSAGVRFGPQMPYHAPKPCIARESHGLKE